MEELSSTLTFRLPVDTIKKYKELSEWQRRLVRNAIKAFMTELVKQAGNIQNVNINIQNVTININMPVGIVKPEDVCDAELIKDRIKELEREKAELEEMLRNLKIRAAKADALEAELKKANEAIRSMKDIIRKYESDFKIVRDFIENKISCQDLENIFKKQTV